MNDKTLIALTTLAEKLGTTTEYLWSVLLKQAPITGAIDMLVFAAWVVAIILWARFVRGKTSKPAPTEKDRYPGAEWTDEAAVFAWLSVFIFGVTMTITIGSCLSITVAAIFNPEYWALHQILK